MKDFIGDELPEGYKPWRCGTCDAVCNFEAMNYCSKNADCGFDKDKPESNGGCFGFMQKENAELKERVEVLDKQFK